MPYYPEIRQWYQRWKRQQPVGVARAWVAKELAHSVYVVLKEGVDFQQQFPGTPLTTRQQASWPRRASPSASLSSARRARALDWEVRRHAEAGIWDAVRPIALAAARGELSPEWRLAVTRRDGRDDTGLPAPQPHTATDQHRWPWEIYTLLTRSGLMVLGGCALARRAPAGPERSLSLRGRGLGSPERSPRPTGGSRTW